LVTLAVYDGLDQGTYEGRPSVGEAYDPLGVEWAVRQNFTGSKPFVDGTEDVTGSGQ
jgi:hypothetical protein